MSTENVRSMRTFFRKCPRVWGHIFFFQMSADIFCFKKKMPAKNVRKKKENVCRIFLKNELWTPGFRTYPHKFNFMSNGVESHPEKHLVCALRAKEKMSARLPTFIVDIFFSKSADNFFCRHFLALKKKKIVRRNVRQMAKMSANMRTFFSADNFCGHLFFFLKVCGHFFFADIFFFCP